MSLTTEVIERLKGARINVQLLIAGFVRLNSVGIVPFAIIQICIAYFMCLEEWDINHKGKFMEVSGIQNQLCECMDPETDPGSNYNSVLGIVKVNSGKHHWKFKITKLDKIKAYWRIVIGVIKINKLNTKELNDMLNMCRYRDAYGLVINSDNRCSWRVTPDGDYVDTPYSEYCKDVGDVIDMYLDLDNWTLSYGMKGVKYENIYEKIDKAEYKMIMTLSRIGTAVELVSYQQIDKIPQSYKKLTEMNEICLEYD